MSDEHETNVLDYDGCDCDGQTDMAVWLGERIPPPVPTATTTTTTSVVTTPAGPLMVYSRTLGETVRVVEAAARLPIPADGEPVTYTRAELVLLDGQPADVLRTAHLLKRAFGGFCEGYEPLPAETGTLF